MSAIIVLAGVGVLAVSAAAILAVLIIGIHRADRPLRHRLTSAPQSKSDAFARRLLLGVRYPESTESPAEPARTESRWPGK
jgi:hypothetical protein